MKWYKLNDVCDVRDGTHESPKYVQKGYPLVTSKNIVDGKIDISNVSYISEEDYIKINQRSKVDDGDILMPMIGTIGKPIVVKKGFDFAIKNVALIKFRDDSKVLSKYVYYVLESSLFKKYIVKENRGGTQKFLSLSNIRNFTIPVPPIEMQNKIIQILEIARLLIEKRQSQISALDELTQSVFLEMFEDIEKDEMPLNFGIKEIITGKSLAGDSPSQYKVINTSAVSYKEFLPDKSKYLPIDYVPPKKHLICKGDVLVSRMNTNELVGAAAYVFDEVENLALPDRIWKLEVDNSKLNSIYTWYFINQQKFRDSVTRISSGTSGSMKNISQQKYLSLLIQVPPLELQNKFENKLINIRKKKKQLQQSKNELQRLYNSLLQKALKGELFQNQVV